MRSEQEAHKITQFRVTRIKVKKSVKIKLKIYLFLYRKPAKNIFLIEMQSIMERRRDSEWQGGKEKEKN